MNTPQRSVRVDDETWEKYGEVCARDGRDRSADLLLFIHGRVAGHIPVVTAVVTPNEGSTSA